MWAEGMQERRGSGVAGFIEISVGRLFRMGLCAG